MILRYIRLYKNLLKTSLVREVQFRSSFLILNIVTTMWAASLIFYYVFVFRHVASIKGWTLGQTLTLVAIYLIFNATFKAIVEQNFSRFSQMIYKGELDYILTKPVSSQFLVSFSRFSLRNFLRFFAGIGLFIWTIVFIKFLLPF